MRNMEFMLKNNFKDNKMIVLGIIFSVLLVGLVAIPTLSEYKNTNPTYTITAWDGTIATSYSDGDGTIDDPYRRTSPERSLYIFKQYLNQ